MAARVSLENPTEEALRSCLSELWVTSVYSLDAPFYQELAEKLEAVEWDIGFDTGLADHVPNRRDAKRRLDTLARSARAVSGRIQPFDQITHVLAQELSVIASTAHQKDDQRRRQKRSWAEDHRRARHQSSRINPVDSLDWLHEELEWLAEAAEQARAHFAERSDEKSGGPRPDNEGAVRQRQLRAVAIAFSDFLSRTESIGEGVGQLSGREEYFEAVMALADQLGLGEWQERYLEEELLRDCVPEPLR